MTPSPVSLDREDPAQQAGDERRAPRQIRHGDVFTERVRARTDRAEAVQRRDAGGCREVSVGAAARAALTQVDADLRRERPRLAVERRDRGTALERRPVWCPESAEATVVTPARRITSFVRVERR